jgi:hypothetical protein
MFWLNVNSPSEPDENTGKMKFVDNTTISGIFKVKKVISRFQAGSFVQSLEANRDLATNYDKSRPTLLKFTDEQEVDEARIRGMIKAEKARVALEAKDKAESGAGTEIGVR